MLEGTLESQFEGKPPITLKAADTVAIAFIDFGQGDACFAQNRR